MATSGWDIYQLRRQLFSIGEDFWIQNAAGQNVYKVDGKVLTLRQTFELQDPGGSALATIEAKLLSLQPTMNIERGGQVWATVKKALFTFLQQRFEVDVNDGRVLESQGDILNHEYEITQGGEVVATISKRWFSITETYGVAVAPGQDDVLFLCAAVCIDEMSETHRRSGPFG